MSEEPKPVLMRFGRFDWERIINRLDLPVEVKAVAWVMAQHGNNDGSRVLIGSRGIAAIIGRSQRTAGKHVDRLLGMGLLKLEHRGGGWGGKGSTNQYTLTSPGDEHLSMRLDPDGVVLMEKPKKAVPKGRPVVESKSVSTQGPVDNSEPDANESKSASTQVMIVSELESKPASHENHLQSKPVTSSVEAGDHLSRNSCFDLPLLTTSLPLTTPVVPLGDQLTCAPVDNHEQNQDQIFVPNKPTPGARAPTAPPDPTAYATARDYLQGLPENGIRYMALAEDVLARESPDPPTVAARVIRAAQIAKDQHA